MREIDPAETEKVAMVKEDRTEEKETSREIPWMWLLL